MAKPVLKKCRVLRSFMREGTYYTPVDKPQFTEEQAAAINAKAGPEGKPFIEAIEAKSAEASAPAPAN